MPWMRSPSPMLSAIGVRGSRLAYGSWKMICIRRRYGFRSAPLSVVMSLAVEPDRARRRLDEPQQQPPDRRLAAARFADEAERLAARDLEAHAVDRLDDGDRPLQDPAADREVLDEVADLDERRRLVALTRLAPTDRFVAGHELAGRVVVDPAAHVVAGRDRQQLGMDLGGQRRRPPRSGSGSAARTGSPSGGR